MLEHIIANNLSLIWLILGIVIFVSGLLAIFLLRAKEKLFGVAFLACGVLLIYLSPKAAPTHNIWVDTFLGISFIAGICVFFVCAAVIVRPRLAAKHAAPPQIVIEELPVSQPVGEIPLPTHLGEVTVTPPAPYPQLQIFNITWLNIFWMVIVFGLLLVILGLPVVYVAGGILGACSAIGVGYWVKKRKYSEKAELEKPRPVVPTTFELHTCEICMGAIKKGLAVVKCGCGRTYHVSCIKRVGECPFCREKL